MESQLQNPENFHPLLTLFQSFKKMLSVLSSANVLFSLMHESRRGDRGVQPPPPPLEKSQFYKISSNSGPDTLKNHKATKRALNVGPSSTHQ